MNIVLQFYSNTINYVQRYTFKNREKLIVTYEFSLLTRARYTSFVLTKYSTRTYSFIETHVYYTFL